MSDFIVSEWFKERSGLKIQPFTVEGVVFELMALDDALFEGVKACDTYEEMLSLAADSGLSFNRNRVVDDAELAKDIDKLWMLGDLDVDCDPCIKYQVGEKVCEISGLSSTLEEQLELEQDTTIDGDNLPHEDVTLGQLQADANAHSIHNNN